MFSSDCVPSDMLMMNVHPLFQYKYKINIKGKKKKKEYDMFEPKKKSCSW